MQARLGRFAPYRSNPRWVTPCCWVGLLLSTPPTITPPGNLPPRYTLYSLDAGTAKHLHNFQLAQ